MEDAGLLQLSPDEMRSLGYAVIDLVVEHFSTLPSQPVGRKAERSTLESMFREPLPELGESPLALLKRIQQEVLPNTLHVDHPRFFAFVPSPNNFVSAMADVLAAGHNVFAGTWFAGSAAAQIELVVIDWLAELCGMPRTAGGLFVSGGSIANLTALAVARRFKLEDRTSGAVAYCSDQTHSSVTRALRVLGLAEDQIRVLPADAAFRMDVEELRRAIEADRSAGARPFCVIANAGTTNTGAVDPLPSLVDLCRTHDLWLHVDGAYGAPAVLTEEGRSLLTGLGGADSLSLDPHKWLFQSFETGCVLVRDGDLLRSTFQVLPEYLRDTERGAEEVNFGNYGLQLTRSFRALKLWMSLKTFGAGAFRDAISHGIRLAEFAERRLAEMDGWEIVTAAQLATITFRFVPGGSSSADCDALNRDIVEALMRDETALVTSTVLRGATVLRLCTINPRTTARDIAATLDHLDQLARNLDP